MAWEGVKIFFKIKNVSISWDVLLHFVNTKNVFLMLVDNVCTIQALFVTKPLHYLTFFNLPRPTAATATTNATA